MPKCRKAWPCPLKVGNTTRNTHPAKADAATAVANSTCDVSATIEPATVESATAQTSTSTAVASRQKRLTGYGKKEDPNQTANYWLCFHVPKIASAKAPLP